MKQHHISVEKTARYFTLGELNQNTKRVIIVLHGYAQLANFFIKKFECLVDEFTFIIAPEGLNKFYWNGMQGKVVASWMTKEDRENDIKDYVNYLDKIVEQLKISCPIEIIGFSQGAATASRWLAKGSIKPSRICLWSGAFPGDIRYFEDILKFKQTEFVLLIGDEDEYISIDEAKMHLEEINSLGINCQFIQFKGKHNIYNEVLNQLFTSSNSKVS